MKAISTILLLLPFFILDAQEYKLRIYQSYISGDISQWEEVLTDMESEYRRLRDHDLLYEIAMAQYGYMGFAIVRDQKRDAKEVLRKAENNVEILLSKNPRWPEVLALRGALYGLKVSLDPIKTVVYGRRALSGNDEAMLYGKTSAQVWMEKGNFEHYKPEIFGRNLASAIEAYHKSLYYFEKDEEKTQNNWLYLNTLVNLARAYEKAEFPSKANNTYLEILSIEPGIKWLSEKEYPRFLKNNNVSPG